MLCQHREGLLLCIQMSLASQGSLQLIHSHSHKGSDSQARGGQQQTTLPIPH
jgi:hypothetical protein